MYGQTQINFTYLLLSIFKIIKNVKISLTIIKLFCRGILTKYCVVDVYKLCLLMLLLFRPGMYTGMAVIIFVSNFRYPGMNCDPKIYHRDLRFVVVFLSLGKYLYERRSENVLTLHIFGFFFF
jgi:hypothetical protein